MKIPMPKMVILMFLCIHSMTGYAALEVKRAATVYSGASERLASPATIEEGIAENAAINAGDNPIGNTWCSSFSVYDGYCARATDGWQDGASVYVYCPDGFVWDGYTNGIYLDTCVLKTVVKDETKHKKQCEASFGDPIHPLNGAITNEIPLGDTFLGNLLRINFDSSYSVKEDSPLNIPSFAPHGFSEPWFIATHKALAIFQASPSLIGALRGDGEIMMFENMQAEAGNSAKIQATSTGFILRVPAENRMETYDSNGKILEIRNISGHKLSYKYGDHAPSFRDSLSSDYLQKITDSFGRQVTFSYQQEATSGKGKLITAINTGYDAIGFTWGSHDNLVSINWQDGTSTSMLYERESLPWALTGIVDENARKVSSYSYDDFGYAQSTEEAGGVNRYSVQYSRGPGISINISADENAGTAEFTTSWINPTGTVLSYPNGNTSAMDSQMVNGQPSLSALAQSPGAGCAASTSEISYDSVGYVISRTDHSGNKTCFANDDSRGTEIARVEGLAAGQKCNDYTLDRSVLPQGVRKVSTSWHPVWNVKSQIAEPQRRITNVYNGQPDPTNGGAIAWCAPQAAVLPDGSPIVVLCKRVEQATTDVDGSRGFTATLSATVAPRVQSWTYNQNGQILTATDPRNNTTTSTYYAATGTDHTIGDLQSVKNAANQVTQYTKYNPAGQVLEAIDPNGITSTYTYDLRQRLTSVSTAGATTRYAYWPTGLLKQVTMPDGSLVAYSYDDAHRLTSISDGLGNKIVYMLDNTGVRTGEDVQDPSGVLSRTLSRVPDALGRIQQITGQE